MSIIFTATLVSNGQMQWMQRTALALTWVDRLEYLERQEETNTLAISANDGSKKDKLVIDDNSVRHMAFGKKADKQSDLVLLLCFCRILQ